MDSPNEREDAIFRAALSLPPNERAAYLDEACGDDPGLRQRVVQGIFREEEKAAATPPAGPAPSPAKPDAPPQPKDLGERAGGGGGPNSTIRIEPPPDGVGEEALPSGSKVEYFGDYILLKEIARGGMGVVYKARQQSLKRLVALKMILKGQLSTEDDVRRFHIEAEAAGNLAHPNIVPIYEVGEHEGQHYFSMELVDGTSLESKLDDQDWKIKERVRLLSTVARAMHHAHQRGILHRDLKPRNILIDRQGQPRVTDFGLARRLEGDGGMTQSGAVMPGTPNYMAPEQVRGLTKAMTTGVDVWALGVTLYQLLTNRLPFKAETRDAIWRRILDEEPKRPRSLNQAVDEDLETICLRCLEKDYHRRGSAEALAQRLELWLEGKPIADLRRYTVRERWVKWVKRKPAIAGLTGAAVLVALLGFAGVLWQWRKAERARETAVQRESEVRMTLSSSDFLQAVRLIAEGNGSDGLAYLARSLSANPTNPAAVTKLVTSLTYQSWMAPTLFLKHGGWMSSAQFSPDGARILTASDNGAARVWDAQSGQPLTEPLRHGSNVMSAQFSPDGKRIVTASADSTARVWDTRSGKPLTEPLKHNRQVYSAQFSPDGRRIVTASFDNTARVWDTQSGQPLTEALKHSDPVVSAQFSPDGKRIATASHDQTARVWDAESGQPLTEALKHEGPVYSAQFSPDGRRIATASEDHTARVWDAQSGQPLTVPLEHSGAVTSAQFSPDGKRIITASADGAPQLWDAQSGQRLTEPLKNNDLVRSAQFRRDGRLIITACLDSARVWDAQSGQPLTDPLQHSNAVWSAQFSPDGKRIVTASADGTAQVWDALSLQPLTEPLRQSGYRVSPQFSPDAKRVLTASGATAQLWDAQSSQPLIEPLRHGSNVMSAQFSPDGNRIVTASEDNTARVWDTLSGQPLTEPLKHNRQVYSAQFSPDGRRIVTASQDNTAQVWNTFNGQPLGKPLKHNGVVSAQFSPDGKRILTISDAFTARVWDAQSGELLTEPFNKISLLSAQFSPDGKRIVTASLSDDTVMVWEAQSGRPLTRPMKHSRLVHFAQFSPDGKRIVTASGGAARVWDAQSGQELTGPLKHSDRVRSAQFSRDAKRIVTASDDGTARVWDTESGQPLTEPLQHNGAVRSAQFSPDGRRIITVSENDDTSRMWDIAPAFSQYPSWLIPLAEACSGQVLNRQGVLEPTAMNRVETLRQILRQLKQAPEDTDWIVWGRWFLADPTTRTISPFSKVTVPQYIENRIKENTAESLNEAEVLACGSTNLIERISQARLKLNQTK